MSEKKESYVELKNVNKSFGGFEASKDININIKKGHLVALLGPSGSGKTTILKMLAGLENADSGDIYIAGTRVNDVKPKDRGIGLVFQSYALFRYKTVYENIAFGLKIEKKDKDYNRNSDCGCDSSRRNYLVCYDPKESENRKFVCRSSSLGRGYRGGRTFRGKRNPDSGIYKYGNEGKYKGADSKHW